MHYLNEDGRALPESELPFSALARRALAALHLSPLQRAAALARRRRAPQRSAPRAARPDPSPTARSRRSRPTRSRAASRSGDAFRLRYHRFLVEAIRARSGAARHRASSRAHRQRQRRPLPAIVRARSGLPRSRRRARRSRRTPTPISRSTDIGRRAVTRWPPTRCDAWLAERGFRAPRRDREHASAETRGCARPCISTKRAPPRAPRPRRSPRSRPSPEPGNVTRKRSRADRVAAGAAAVGAIENQIARIRAPMPAPHGTTSMRAPARS